MRYRIHFYRPVVDAYEFVSRNVAPAGGPGWVDDYLMAGQSVFLASDPFALWR